MIVAIANDIEKILEGARIPNKTWVDKDSDLQKRPIDNIFQENDIDI